MKKRLFYDCEIAKCIPDKYCACNQKYEYCGGWSDFANMGVAVVGVYIQWRDEYKVFLRDELANFQSLAKEADEIIGFNSVSFDDNLMKANNVEIETDYDLLCETRVAAGMPPEYVRGVTRAGYSLEQLALANLGRGKSGTGELAPQLWQDGKRDEVIQYCLDDVRLLVELWKMRSHLVDPTNDEILLLKGGNRIEWKIEKFRRWWQTSDFRIFAWAIVHDDISKCELKFKSPIYFDWLSFRKEVSINFRIPSVKIYIPSRVKYAFRHRNDEPLVTDDTDTPW